MEGIKHTEQCTIRLKLDQIAYSHCCLAMLRKVLKKIRSVQVKLCQTSITWERLSH